MTSSTNGPSLVDPDTRPRRTLPLAVVAIGLFAVQAGIIAVALLVTGLPV